MPKLTMKCVVLWQNCADLPGGEQDYNHHNLVIPYRGHLVMP